MLKKSISYEDFNGNTLTEDFYFNLSKSEISKAQLSMDGGLAEKLEKIAKSQSVPAIAKVFEEFIDMSYGIKSDDGKRFIKSPEILSDFKATNAYDVLYMELISDVKSAISFINGIIPSDMAKKLAEDESLQKKLTDLTEV